MFHTFPAFGGGGAKLSLLERKVYINHRLIFTRAAGQGGALHASKVQQNQGTPVPEDPGPKEQHKFNL